MYVYQNLGAECPGPWAPCHPHRSPQLSMAVTVTMPARRNHVDCLGRQILVQARRISSCRPIPNLWTTAEQNRVSGLNLVLGRSSLYRTGVLSWVQFTIRCGSRLTHGPQSDSETLPPALDTGSRWVCDKVNSLANSLMFPRICPGFYIRNLDEYHFTFHSIPAIVESTSR